MIPQASDHAYPTPHPDPDSAVKVATPAGGTSLKHGDLCAAQPVSELVSATPFDDEGPLPAPSGAALLHAQVHAMLDRFVLIADHLQAIDDGLLDIAHRQAIVLHHCAAVKGMLEREVFP
jgi:hypothetical protein